MKKTLSLSVLYMIAATVIATLLLVNIVKAEDVSSSSQNQTTESFTERKQKQLDSYKLEAEKKREEAKEQARQKVEDAKKEVNAKKVEVRQKSCEARAEALKNKIEATSAAAVRHQEKIDEFNKKVDAFIQKYNLTITDYDILAGNVATKAAESQQAVASLKNYPSSVDCSNVDAATASVIAYKSLVSAARESLKEYRTATKDLLVAAKQAAESTTSIPENGSNSSAVEAN